METVALDAKLEAGTATETVTVTSAPPRLETSDAMLGLTVQQELYFALPVLQNGTQRSHGVFYTYGDNVGGSALSLQGADLMGCGTA
jgi:hypothetical protein